MSKYYLLLLTVLAFSSTVQAETIYATHKYIMGDNDSRNDARQLCFIEAKRKVLEKAGTFIQSQTNVTNGQLTRDEINSFAGALLKVETIEENWVMAGEAMAVVLKVKADVDTSLVQSQLKQILGDSSIKQRVVDQQSQLQALERTVAKLQGLLGSASAEDASALRRQRNVAFKKISEVDQILLKIETKTKLATENVEVGMTLEEVEQLAGKYRAKLSNRDRDSYNYGKVWVIIERGLVGCVVKNNSHFNEFRSCSSYPLLYKKYLVK